MFNLLEVGNKLASFETLFNQLFGMIATVAHQVQEIHANTVAPPTDSSAPESNAQKVIAVANEGLATAAAIVDVASKFIPSAPVVSGDPNAVAQTNVSSSPLPVGQTHSTPLE